MARWRATDISTVRVTVGSVVLGLLYKQLDLLSEDEVTSARCCGIETWLSTNLLQVFLWEYFRGWFTKKLVRDRSILDFLDDGSSYGSIPYDDVYGLSRIALRAGSRDTGLGTTDDTFRQDDTSASSSGQTHSPESAATRKPTSAREILAARAGKSINAHSSGRIFVTLARVVGRDKRQPAGAPSFTEPKRICPMPPKSPDKKPSPVLEPLGKNLRFSTTIDALRDSLKEGSLNSEESDGNAVVPDGPAPTGNKTASPASQDHADKGARNTPSSSSLGEELLGSQLQGGTNDKRPTSPTVISLIEGVSATETEKPEMLPAYLSRLVLILLSFHGQEVLAFATASDHDFRYMKSVHNATHLPFEEEYDYIVIGGGTAGCPLAATLSQKYSVLVLERGNVPKAQPNTLNVSGFFSILNQPDNSTTPAQRFKSEEGVTTYRGRVLGGSSMINAGFYTRAENVFFRKSGVEWDMDLVEKADHWVEETIVSRPRELAVWQSALRGAMLEAGVVPNNGFTLNHKLGTKVSGSIFDQMGKRHGAVELLNRANFRNLKIGVHATVDRIIFSTKASKPSAIGVIYTDSNEKSHRVFVRRKGEVILSAGAIGSPQLLLLSGVGPHSYLSSLHIPIVQSQPNVGKFMFDNPRNAVTLKFPFPVEISPVQTVGITNNYYIQGVSSLQNSSSPANWSVGTIAEKVPGPLSRGSLRLNSSTDVKVSPRVRFNYFANPVDLSKCVSGMRKIGEMLNTKTMDQFKFEDSNGSRRFSFSGASLPSNYKSNDSSVEAFCRSTVGTIHHYHGGCLVGKVVNGNFRVKGIDSLRVVDGSTFTTTPGTNPQATVMMLGRYVGLKMLWERREGK
ncbi:(R)-mandelonitrile lyase 1 [Morus notabilis]|uniref:(R)-mandelonitrile lyase 1 n=1 Tax=Morus notabilis TaxID=981085 RepID=UPI000CED5C46|nr:(R)-mandelonitrile lyase 1 [Morus notabilis]